MEVACDKQPGPRLGIRLIEEHLTGVKLTQTDWHLIRSRAEESINAPLSQATAGEDIKARTAIALTKSLRVPRDEAEAFIAEFTQTKTTMGTCVALTFVATNGIPAEVISRKRRNRGRATRPKKSTPQVESQFCVVTQDLTPSGVVVDGVNQRIPLYRVTHKGRLVGVTISREAAREMADKFNANPRW